METISELEARPPVRETLVSLEGIESQGLILLVEDEPMVRSIAEAMLK